MGDLVPFDVVGRAPPRRDVDLGLDAHPVAQDARLHALGLEQEEVEAAVADLHGLGGQHRRGDRADELGSMVPLRDQRLHVLGEDSEIH